ncbi:hypothetical protein OsccyDRAFT_1686 [Leptolyngbyaceae cyanobacterium JSC-12]|nr:hypothetical protein OsccyDRAFT_1686 [Leptolyngbyaceae cyanobacterium JSC-12]
MRTVTPQMLDAKTPDDVVIRAEARKPVTDPTLGIAVTPNRNGSPRHRLVVLGDSLSHGFQSGAIFKTNWSYPAMIARELGWQELRYPTYNSPGDGLPLNLEAIAQQLEKRFGTNLDFWEFLPLLLFLREYLDTVEDYWERGQGNHAPDQTSQTSIYHNLAVYGWDLRNTISRTADICREVIEKKAPQDNFLRQVVENHNERAAIRVLNSARNSAGKALSPVEAAIALSTEDTFDNEDGIETLIVLIGANNALGSLLTFRVNWSGPGYDDMEMNNQYTVWRPIHFQAELDQLVAKVKQVRARHVIFGTVPHVTIAPFARGVGTKVKPGSRYFPYYTVFWIDDKGFKPKKHPHLTEQEVRAIDSAIDQYNDSITEAVRQARQAGYDWYLFDTAGLLDRLAVRRYIADPAARPSWWDEVGGQYPLPPALQALTPVPDSRFFIANERGRTQGGLFSLDGIHPTTIGYGILAQELINVMQIAGVPFYRADGTPRTGAVQVDFAQLIAEDTLISKPPRVMESVIERISWLDTNFNLFNMLLRSSY